MQHHAYLLLGEREESKEFLRAFLAEEGVEVLGNPDVLFSETDVFSVHDARDLSERASAKAFGNRKVFAIYSNKLTSEAQNALLKTLEDPVENTHFFISVREMGMLLPTLLSRLEVLERVASNSSPSEEARKFLKSGVKERLNFVKKFTDDKKVRGAGYLAEFLDSLVFELKEGKASLQNLKTVANFRKYARDSGAMPRIILEHLALVL